MYLKPHVNFEVKSLEDTINIFVSFLETDEDLNYNSAGYIANHYNINLDDLKGKSVEARKEIITNILTPIYNVKLNQMKSKIEVYQNYWNENANKVCEQFEKIFKVGFKGVRQFTAYINLNPMCPRYLNDDSFDIYYINKPEDAFKTCVHELIHFYWFQVWQEVFDDANPETFECPHLEWLFSEIVVDPIIYYSELSKFNFKQPAYAHFYTSKFLGETAIEFFRKLYRSNSLETFMEKGIKILKDNEAEAKTLIK